MDIGDSGRQILREMTSAEFMEAKAGKVNAFNAPLHSYMDEVCFGRVWADEGIDRKQRSILNIALLTALNRPNQLKNHVEIAFNNGLTVKELQSILVHAAMYCGIPAAVDSFRIAEEVVKGRKLLD